MEAPEYYPKTASGESKPLAPEHFLVEDLLDFSNDDSSLVAATPPTNDVVMEDGFLPPSGANNNYYSSSTDQDSSTVTTAVDSCNSSDHHPNNNSSFTSLDPHFCSDLSVPYDDLAELEWLSNFVEESFSSDDLQKLHLISGFKARPDDASDATTTRVSHPDPATTTSLSNSITMHHTSNPNPIFHPDTMSVPAKARSKRSRAAPINWASRLLVLADSSPSSPSSSDPESLAGPPPPLGRKPAAARKQRGEGEGEGRKCLHCATDKTPQWRTGPMGPKTLCNACGVRYKSGRLVPEYRPAASPTFVLTKHSNSHRKVLELRRQKELLRAQQQHHHHQFLHHHHHHHQGGGMVFDMGSSNGDDFLIHQHVGPDFRQLI